MPLIPSHNEYCPLQLLSSSYSLSQWWWPGLQNSKRVENSSIIIFFIATMVIRVMMIRMVMISNRLDLQDSKVDDKLSLLLPILWSIWRKKYVIIVILDIAPCMEHQQGQNSLWRWLGQQWQWNCWTWLSPSRPFPTLDPSSPTRCWTSTPRLPLALMVINVRDNNDDDDDDEYDDDDDNHLNTTRAGRESAALSSFQL